MPFDYAVCVGSALRTRVDAFAIATSKVLQAFFVHQAFVWRAPDVGIRIRERARRAAANAAMSTSFAIGAHAAVLEWARVHALAVDANLVVSALQIVVTASCEKHPIYVLKGLVFQSTHVIYKQYRALPHIRVCKCRRLCGS